MHDLETVDQLRERMDVGYKEAMLALDEAEGDVVRALAILEDTTAGGMRVFEERVKEGVKRGLSGDTLERLRWKILGQPVVDAPVALIGAAAVIVGLLALLVSSSTVETEFAEADRNNGEG